jgi:CRP/FNR family cyclic AMP-dependent transcriptional regulator
VFSLFLWGEYLCPVVLHVVDGPAFVRCIVQRLVEASERRIAVIGVFVLGVGVMNDEAEALRDRFLLQNNLAWYISTAWQNRSNDRIGPMDARVTDLGEALGVLAAQGWFSQRSPQTRARLGAIARLRSFAKNDRVYLAGDPPNGVFGLISGSLHISIPRADGEDYTLHRAGVGFWVGDLALFSQGARLISVHAAEPTLMVQLPARGLRRLAQEDPRLYADFYALTYENFRTAFQIISNLAISSTDKRLADRLLLEVEARGDGNGWISISQTELASLTAVSLPTLKRVVRRFADMRLINHKYARIQVLDQNALKQICKG